MAFDESNREGGLDEYLRDLNRFIDSKSPE